jgi:5-methyltetrahydropteroyltriglutamate--homocysteine methyltransferase
MAQTRDNVGPRIKTTVVGSYPVPDWLAALPSEQALLDATRVVIHTQERAGIDLVCDGELSRFDVNHPETNGMIEYFVRPMAGIRTAVRFDEVTSFRAQRGMGFRTRPPAVVDGPVGAGTLDLPHACARAKRLAARPFKFTLTGPHMLAKTLLDRHYASVPELALALADALADQVRELDADVVQVDEANLPGNPDEWRWAADAINRVLRAVKTVAAVHLCFGNYGGQSVQHGAWGKLIEYLNALEADHIVMETAHRSPEEIAVFRELRPQIGFGLGVIDIKSTEIETPDAVARAIERAEKTLGPGRVTYVHPDCGFWMLKRSIADGKLRALVRGRDRYEGRNAYDT